MPPVTLVGLTESEESVGEVVVVPCGVKLRDEDHDPAVPAPFRPRTLHQCCRLCRVIVAVYWEAVAVVSITRGDENELESSTWIW